MEFLILFYDELERNSDFYPPIECNFLEDQISFNFFEDTKYTLKEILTKENIESCLKKEKVYVEDVEINFHDYMDKYKEVMELLEDISKIEYTIKLDNIDNDEYINKFKKFIQKNSFLKECKIKIQISEDFSLSESSYEQAKEIFKDFQNVSFFVEGNDSTITLDEFKNTYEKIDEIVQSIKKYNFSPLEQLLYTYDIVRNRVYTLEKNNEDSSTSRDLSSVLFGKSIVCLGYARIYNAILEKLDFKTRVSYLYPTDENKEKGHARNVCYVKDNKYKIDGIYYFDSTWDSRKELNNDNYLNRYRNFCRDKDFFKRKKYYDATFGIFSNHGKYKNIDKKRILKEIEKVRNTKFSNIDIYDLIFYKDNPNLIDMDVVRFINHVLQFTNKEKFLLYDIFSCCNIEYLNKLDNNKDKIIGQMKKCINLCYPKFIDEKIFLEVLYNVRKVQYYNNPRKYRFDENSLKKTTIDYMMNLDALDKLPNNEDDNISNNDFLYLLGFIGVEGIVNREYKNKNYEKGINEIKLTKTLSKVLEKKLKI